MRSKSSGLSTYALPSSHPNVFWPEGGSPEAAELFPRSRECCCLLTSSQPQSFQKEALAQWPSHFLLWEGTFPFSACASLDAARFMASCLRKSASGRNGNSGGTEQCDTGAKLESR